MFWNTVGTFVVGSGHKVVCFGKKFVFLTLFYISVHAFRLERLEESLRDEDMSEATKTEKRLQHAVKETEFLRLRRSRLGVDDFDPIKVIGRGAFGEVSQYFNKHFNSFVQSLTNRRMDVNSISQFLKTQHQSTKISNILGKPHYFTLNEISRLTSYTNELGILKQWTISGIVN